MKCPALLTHPLSIDTTCLVYLSALLTLGVPVADSLRVAWAMGGSYGALTGLAASGVVLLAGWRAVRVARHPEALRTPPVLPAAHRVVRRLGMALMVTGLAALLARQFLHAEVLASVNGWVPAGLLVFEFSRLMGFEQASTPVHVDVVI
jgi:hypothetical protein